MSLHDELPELSTVLLPRPKSRQSTLNVAALPSLRRSPRKHHALAQSSSRPKLETIPIVAVSSQQRSSPRKQATTKRSTQAKNEKVLLKDVMELKPVPPRLDLQSRIREIIEISDDSEDDIARLGSTSLTADHSSDKENSRSKVFGNKKTRQPTSAMSKITQVARRGAGHKTMAPALCNPYILREAYCDEDLLDSSAENEEDEDEDTDLSGFIVDDDAEISFHDFEAGVSSESEQYVRPRRNHKKSEQQDTRSRRRLVRGSKKRLSDSEGTDDLGLSNALKTMELGGKKLEQEENAHRRKTLEVIDLTSSPIPAASPPVTQDDSSEPELEHERGSAPVLDPFLSSNTALQLQPSTKAPTFLLPAKGAQPITSQALSFQPASTSERPVTPPATPPRSPSKLRSPTKLKSPTKTRSPVKDHKAHRQSTDAFWDHGAVNEWTDTYSPKKAPLLSPRKNPLAHFTLYADDDLDNLLDEEKRTFDSSQDPFNESSDSLPSPCDSPTKSRSPSKSAALKSELARLREEKKAKLATKKKFDAEKHQMAIDLLAALDSNITCSRISKLSQSTGGIKVIWSKTLRSTAGRANWKRTVTKPSGSPVKGNPDSVTVEKQPGVIVQHFASIELAEKIIDRPERLVNTLAHEFCHLANFMVSGIRDQPHGSSFQQWGKKVTTWLKSSPARGTTGWCTVWTLAEVTTKHSYIVETKYLWVCSGRPKEKMGLAARMLELEGEEGCGAEYGRHSKSIDVEKQRCGVCKGFLVQVRPAPRATSSSSPRKRSPVKGGLRSLREESSGEVKSLERLLEEVDLSD